jgi:hypothetical protein
MSKILRALIRVTVISVIAGFITISFFACGKTGEETPGTTEIVKGTTEKTETGTNKYESREYHVEVLELNFRTEPDPNSEPVRGRETLYYGEEFEIIKEEGDWAYVRLDDSTEGWLRSEYEGKEYISPVDTTGTGESISSNEFLDYATAEARKWASDSYITFLFGTKGSLDGKCRNWRAFYKSPQIPGKKFICMFGDIQYEIRGLDEEFDQLEEPLGQEGQKYYAEEWDEDWIQYKVRFGDAIPVAPGPPWWYYHKDGIEITGDRFISTTELCNSNNVNIIISIDRNEIPGELAEIASDWAGFIFVIDGSKWKIIVKEIYEGDYVFEFDAKDGQFLGFHEIKYR